MKIQRVESLNQLLYDVDMQIRNRAYDRFLHRGGYPGKEIEDWTAACADLLVQPAINLSETEGSFVVVFQIRAEDTPELECVVTDRAILLQSPEEFVDMPGFVHVREFAPRRVFRSVVFPRAVDPSSIAVEDEGSTLRVTVAIAGSSPVKTKPKAKAKANSKTKVVKRKASG
jgi:HSP20 family molecular chaperone IbpA